MSDTKLIQEVLKKITSMDSRMESMDSRITSMDSRITSMDSRIGSMDKKMDRGFDEVKVMISENGGRLDKLGLQLAELEDDAPTREEHDKLEDRVKDLERQVTVS